MHAYLVIGKDSSAKAHDLKPAKAREVPLELKKISDVKELIRFTNSSLAEPIMFILKDFNEASTEAQNAFLKRLEEPQANVSYVLTAGSDNGILPTVISRCHVIRLNQKREVGEESVSEAIEFIESSVPERFSKIANITKREDAVVFLEEFITAAHTQIADKPDTARALEKADETLFRIKGNANPTLQLTNFAISF